MNSKLSKSVLQQIKKEELQPLPKYYFVLKNIFWWGAFLLSVLMGAAGFAVVVFAFFHQRFDFADFFQRGDFGVWLGMMPFFWIFFFGLFVWVSFWGVKHTKKAYRIPFWVLITGNIVLTLLLGALLYTSDQAERFEQGIVRHMPFLDTVREGRLNRWERPERGFTRGRVIEIGSDFIKTKNREGREMKILLTDVEWRDGLSLETVKEDQLIRAVGTPLGKGVFQAKSIAPFDPSEARELRKNERPEGRRRPPQRPPLEENIE